MKIKDLFAWVSASILCLKFHFLYPRNRFTGKHYTNWRLEEKIKKLYVTNFSQRQMKVLYKQFPFAIDKSIDNSYYWNDGYAKWKFLPDKAIIQYIWYNILYFILRVLHCIPTYTELDQMPAGWRKTFGIAMCKEIKQELLKNGRKTYNHYRIMQIKEKFGALRWYDNGCTEEIFSIITKYEDISYHTCICCGKPAKFLTKGYILPYCENCINKDPYTSYTLITD